MTKLNLQVRWKVDLAENQSIYLAQHSGDNGDYDKGAWMDVTLENYFVMTVSEILHSLIHTKT